MRVGQGGSGEERKHNSHAPDSWVIHGSIQATSIYAHLITVIGAQHVHYASPSEAAKLAAEIAALFEQPEKLKEIITSIDVHLSKTYREDLSLPYSLQNSSMATLDECYIELTLISQQEQETHESAFKHNKVAPDYEQLYHQEAPIQVSELWKPEAYTHVVRQTREPQGLSKPPYRLAIRGAAGMGKTTLLRSLAAQWGKRREEENASSNIIIKHTLDLTHWREQFHLLLHIPLRDLLTYEPIEEVAGTLSRREKMLATWLSSHYPNLNQQEFIVLMLCLTRPQEVHRVLPGRVLLLLDGLDEVSGLLEEPNALSGQNLEAHHVAEKRHHEQRQELLLTLLGYDHWLLTTRPHTAEHPKLSGATHHLALTGFSVAQMSQYVERFCTTLGPQENGSKNTRDVMNWLKQPALRVLAQVPLQLELLCSVALDTLAQQKPLSQSGQGSDLTQLYTRMLVVLCRRYLAKFPELLLPGEKAYLACLPEKILLLRCRDALNWLSACALEAMQRQQVVWRVSSFRNAPSFSAKEKDLQTLKGLQQLEAAFDHFGLLAPMGIKKPNPLEQDYYFQHLTYQEF
ncbi:MAG: NACHT domain-containing protein [Gammaproteobacteria bacterium]|nr:NACHT domain-containing protein [Gammaproteobacteria bacterium]